MEKDDRFEGDEREPEGLIVYKREAPLFQKICLCDYMEEMKDEMDEKGDSN